MLRVIRVALLAFLAAPLLAEAQPPAKVFRIGLLGGTSPEVSPFWGGFFNLKTAKALGLTLPPAVLARADEVIK